MERASNARGFTLIELMVVVVIMGTLMAIAVPTFLGTRGSANDASAKSLAYNALENEKAYYANNGAFLDLTGGAGSGSLATQLDPTLPWSGASTVAAGQVTAVAGNVSGGSFVPVATAGSNGPAVLVETLSKSGSCLYVFDNEVSASSVDVGYAMSDNAAGCAPPSTGVSVPASSPSTTGGTAGTHIETAASLSASDWYAGW